jgi:hypothetical protein
MPFYKVWYRNNPEPLEISSAGRLSEEEILDHVLEHERNAASPDASRGAPAARPPTAKEIIGQHKLAPVRYTEDEGEPFTIE